MGNGAVTFENLEQYSIPLSEHPYAWVFETKEGKGTRPEYADQMVALNEEGAKFLRDFEMNQQLFGKYLEPTAFFQSIEEFNWMGKSKEDIKKWLYQRGIPFSKKVYWCHQLHTGFVLTWKMVIKFSDTIFFGSDETVWDESLSWGLIYDHNEYFYFGDKRPKYE